MSSFPPKLQQTIDMFDVIADRTERIELLISYSDRFLDVPLAVAVRPFPEANRVPGCESEVFVWAVPRDDGTLDFHFAVENPQGLSAKAMAVILQRSVSGVLLDEIVAMPFDFANRIFGDELSMGKNMGLMNMVQMVQAFAKRRMAARQN